MTEDREDDSGVKYKDYGALAWFAYDGHFHDSTSEDYDYDISHWEFDSLVLQTGPSNSNYATEE